MYQPQPPPAHVRLAPDHLFYVDDDSPTTHVYRTAAQLFTGRHLMPDMQFDFDGLIQLLARYLYNEPLAKSVFGRVFA